MAVVTATFTNEIGGGGNGINSFDTVLATARTGSNLGVATYLNTLNAGMSYSFDSTNYTIVRNFFHFDISSIPTTAVIVSAFLRLPGTNTSNNNTDTDTLNVVKSTIASNTVVATSDWTNFDTTVFGSLAFASYNNAANNDIAINATGLTYLQTVVGSHAKLAVVTAKDIAAATPTGYNNQTANPTGLLLSVTYQTTDEGDYSYLM